jgi:hypothetical protein
MIKKQEWVSYNPLLHVKINSYNLRDIIRPLPG